MAIPPGRISDCLQEIHSVIKKNNKPTNQLSYWFKQDSALEALMPVNISGSWRSVTVSFKELEFETKVF